MLICICVSDWCRSESEQPEGSEVRAHSRSRCAARRARPSYARSPGFPPAALKLGEVAGCPSNSEKRSSHSADCSS